MIYKINHGAICLVQKKSSSSNLTFIMTLPDYVKNLLFSVWKDNSFVRKVFIFMTYNFAMVTGFPQTVPKMEFNSKCYKNCPCCGYQRFVYVFHKVVLLVHLVCMYFANLGYTIDNFFNIENRYINLNKVKSDALKTVDMSKWFCTSFKFICYKCIFPLIIKCATDNTRIFKTHTPMCSLNHTYKSPY